MLNTFFFAVLAGVAMGYLAGIGVGGGSLLILWLNLVLELPQATARGINLMFFLAAAGAVSVFRLKKGTLHLKPLLSAILAGCASAALFSWLSTGLDTESLRKAFGILLLVTGMRELCYRPRKLR